MRSLITNKNGRVKKGLPDAALVALHQIGHEASLSDLARALAAARSSVLLALRGLRSIGAVRATKLRYTLGVPEAFTRGTLYIAARRIGRTYATAVGARANPSVEFAALDRRGRLTVVYSPTADSVDILRFEQLIRDAFPEVVITTHDAEKLRRGTVEAVDRTRALRRQLARSLVLKGAVATTFPDRSKRGKLGRARALGHPHPTLPTLSRRNRQGLARKFELAELSLFGSAVRSDFRPDSDVDVLVRLRRDTPLTLRTLSGLRAELERLLGRRVDVLEESNVIEELRPLIERDKVTLYGRTLSKRVSPRTGKEVRPTGH